MEVKGKFSIDCGRCGKFYEFNPEDVDFKMTEKKGDDECYVWEKVYNCTKCGNHISIKYQFCLTPDGEVKDKKVDTIGVKKIEEDSFEFSK